MRESNGSSVVGDDVGDLVGTEGSGLHSAELEGSFLWVDFGWEVSSLGVIENSEKVTTLFDGDDIHKSTGEPVVPSDFVVNLDKTFLILADFLHFGGVEGELQSVNEQIGEGNAFSQLVWSSGRSGGLNC